MAMPGWFPQYYDESIILSMNMLVRGQRVAIVGGGDFYDKDEVDSFDIVVRTNDHIIRQGGKFDILYHTLRGFGLETHRMVTEYEGPWPAIAYLNLVDGPWEAGMSIERVSDKFALHFLQKAVKVGYFAQGEWQVDNPYGEEFNWLPEIHRKYNCKLLTGLVALADLMRWPCKEIHTFGMNLHIDKSRRLPDYRDSHWLPGQLAFLKDCVKDPRVFLNKELTEAMENLDKLYGANPRKSNK